MNSFGDLVTSFVDAIVTVDAGLLSSSTNAGLLRPIVLSSVFGVQYNHKVTEKKMRIIISNILFGNRFVCLKHLKLNPCRAAGDQILLLVIFPLTL